MTYNIFDEVKSQLNIKQVIEHYGFKVNRARQFICPFHSDHKPSASIKNDYFHCFVCGAGGDLITFTAKLLNLHNIEAARELAKEFKLNIDIDTEEERKAQASLRRNYKKEISRQSGLRDKFSKDSEFKSQQKVFVNYKLRGEIQEVHRRKEQEREKEIQRVGFILADFHRFLWQGIHLYSVEDKRHIRGLQELTACEYYLDCYDENPAEFCKYNMGVVKRYEEELQRSGCIGKCDNNTGSQGL